MSQRLASQDSSSLRRLYNHDLQLSYLLMIMMLLQLAQVFCYAVNTLSQVVIFL
jgi:hypothetical protein